MAGGISPEIQLLETSNPQAMLNRANILTELQQENGTKLSLVTAANRAAERASLLAEQESRQATKLSDEMRAKVVKIQAKENILNSALYKKALEVYQQTGHYPVHLEGDSIGVQALRKALTKVGDPYVWGAAGPNAFDCSGLVMWAYAQIGISLDHFTGDQWNEGEHISRSQLEPGDLVFFFPDIGHVGIYVGNGMMLDAPTFGQPRPGPAGLLERLRRSRQDRLGISARAARAAPGWLRRPGCARRPGAGRSASATARRRRCSAPRR